MPVTGIGSAQNVRNQKRGDAPFADTPDPEDLQSHPLDSDEWQQNLRQLQSWRRQSRIAHQENREQMAIDEDYYDGIQFEAEDLAILNERAQPANYWNVIKNTLNWILGTERKTRIDYSILPRTKKASAAAKSKTKVMKYISDCNRGEFARSQAFEDAVKAGIGWLEVGLKNDTEDEPLFWRRENWRNMWFDNLGAEGDCSDWRYVIREKWLDLDVAQAMFPERAESLKLLSTGTNSFFPYLPEDEIIDSASEFDTETGTALIGGAYDGLRERIKVIEMWYRVPARVQIMKIRDGQPYASMSGSIYRETDDLHGYLVRNQIASLYDAVKMVVRVAMWAGDVYLQDELSPYNHNRFPFIPVFCYRFARNGLPYGVIRDLRSPQDDLNKRKNRALFLLSSNRFYFETGAMNNPALFQDEVNRPDGMAEVNKNAITGGMIKEIDNGRLAMEHIELARDNERFIESISGVTPQNKGSADRSLSGKAIQSLQAEGLTTNGVVFDNFYNSFQLVGEIALSNIEQFKDQTEQIRITGDQGKPEFFTINEPTASGEVKNSITANKADFIVGKQDYRETIRQAALDRLGELLTSMAQSGGKSAEVAFAMLDMYVDMMDSLPNKDECVRRIREFNGQRDPDDEMTPEEKIQAQQLEQMKQQEMQRQKQLQDALMQLELRTKEAEVSAKEAKALRDTVEASMKKLDGFMKAMEVAGAIKIAPELVQGADVIVEEASQIQVGGAQ